MHASESWIPFDRNLAALLVAAGLALLGGCADPVFTEADEGQEREVSRGAAFSVILPGVSSAPRPDPVIAGAYIRFVDRHIEGDPPREIFRFVAEGQGESDIRIPPSPSPGGSAQLEYVIRVRIRQHQAGSSSGGPSAPSPPPKY